MEDVNVICVASNSKALIKMSLWNIHFGQQISIGKIFSFLNWEAAGMQADCQEKPSKFVNVASVYLPPENKVIVI